MKPRICHHDTPAIDTTDDFEQRSAEALGLDHPVTGGAEDFLREIERLGGTEAQQRRIFKRAGGGGNE